MIELSDVSFAYSSKHPVLTDLSLHFRSGCFHGVFGPNGCGKSTLLKLITGELAPQSGRIAPRWSSPSVRARSLALVEQEIPGRLPFTVNEIVALGRYPWERTGSSGKSVENILDTMDLAPLSGTQYADLSGGERQRVMLARALAQDTPILLLDEPASSLDPGFQHYFYRLLRKQADSGKCVVMVTHDLFIAPRYLEESVLLCDGRIFRQGPPAETLSAAALKAAFRLPEVLT